MFATNSLITTFSAQHTDIDTFLLVDLLADIAILYKTYGY